MKTHYLQAIRDQREEIKSYSGGHYVSREVSVLISPKSRLISIITGVRRSGKSTLAHLALLEKNYAYINFDDERLDGLTSSSLNEILENLYTVYGDFKYLFLDEIQNISGWSLFVNRLQRTNITIILTGSNSKLLSREFASHLTGRYRSIELFPFSFREFLLFKKAEIQLQTTKSAGIIHAYFLEYLKKGGFPEVVKGENVKRYSTELFHSITSRDILFRYNIKHKKTFKDIALFLISNYAREISYNRIKNIFGLGSDHTAKNYVDFLEEAYLIISLQKFSFKRQESLKYKKVYAIDTSFIYALSSDFSANTGYIYENLVLLELHRRKAIYNFEIFYYKKNYEVDFVIKKKNKITELIQVCLDIDNEKTFRREIQALINASKELKPEKLIIITDNEEKIIETEKKKIQCIPIIKWLLNK